MCCAVPPAPCGAYPSSTYTFSPDGNVETLAGVVPGEELDQQAAHAGSQIEGMTFANDSSSGLVVSMMQPSSSNSSKRGFHCSHSSHEVIWNSETFPFLPSSRRFCTSGGHWQ